MLRRSLTLSLCAVFGLLVLPLIGAVLPADACSPNEWPSFQPRLDPGPSNSPVKATRPTLSLSPAAADTREERSEYGGLWEGWMCRDKVRDVVVAVARVTNEGAEVEFSTGNKRWGKFSSTLSMKFDESGEVLCGTFPSEQALMLGMRGDGHMNVMWAHPGRWWCSGIMRRTQVPPAS